MQIQHSLVKKFIILFVKTLSIYLILSVFLYAYLGVIYPGGSLYAPFLAKYSLIKLMLNSLIYPIKFVMSIAGYHMMSYQNNVSIAHEKGILIGHGCLGLDIMIAYTALILGYPGKKKLLFLIAGLLFIHVLNITRMLLILVTIKTNPSIVEQSHDLLNIAGYVCILIFYYVYVQKFSKESAF